MKTCCLYGAEVDPPNGPPSSSTSSPSNAPLPVFRTSTVRRLKEFSTTAPLKPHSGLPTANSPEARTIAHSQTTRMKQKRMRSSPTLADERSKGKRMFIGGMRLFSQQSIGYSQAESAK